MMKLIHLQSMVQIKSRKGIFQIHGESGLVFIQPHYSIDKMPYQEFRYIITMSKVEAQKIWVLSALDHYLKIHQKDSATYMAVFSKKKTLIDLIQGYKIDAKKYKTLLVKAYKEEQGLVKDCAQADLVKIADANSEEALQNWFRQMIEATGAQYEQQLHIYTQYQKGQQPQPQSASQPQPKAAGGIDTQQLVSFKALDNLMEKHSENASIYGELLTRKQKLMGLVQSKALTAAKYQQTLKGYLPRVTDESVLSDYQMELDAIEDFHDGNLDTWFKEVIGETQDEYKEQQKHLQELATGRAKPKQRQQSVEVKAEPKKSKGPVAAPKPIDIHSFKVLEEQLEGSEDDKKKYQQLLERKVKLIDAAQKGVLNGAKYKALLQKAIQQTHNPQIKESMEFQLSQLDDFHDGNANAWFEDVLSSAKLMLDDQKETLKSGPKAKKESLIDDPDDIQISDDDDVEVEVEEKKEVKPAPSASKASTTTAAKSTVSQSIDLSQYCNLKALDELMEQNNKNPGIFCACFERKDAIINMIRSGKMTAQKYKQMQERAVKSSIDGLKDAAEMDLFDLKDMCDGNVQEWFESAVNDSGFFYEDQQALYEKLKVQNKPSQATSKASSLTGPSSPQSKAQASQLVCFSAIGPFFEWAVEKSDIVYYKQLLNKRQQLMTLVSQGKLVPEKYRAINKAVLNKNDNQFLLYAIRKEEQRLVEEFKENGEEWFKAITELLKKSPPEMVLPENQEMKKVNALPAKGKKDYLIKKMAAYQSLLMYCIEHKISMKDNEYLIKYHKEGREQGGKALKFIDEDPKLDVYNLAEELFPTIDQKIFYGDRLQALKDHIAPALKGFVQEINEIKEYTAKIKKSTNPKNLQNSKNQIQQCQETMKKLQDWPGKELVGPPKIETVKEEHYNLDLISHLDHNEIEIDITQIDGITDKLYLRIYVCVMDKERYEAKIKHGSSQAKVVVKLPNNDITDLIRGAKQSIMVRFFEKGFFGGLSLKAEEYIPCSFLRNNVIEDQIVCGHMRLHYNLRVKKPHKPLVYEVNHVKVTIPPKYAYNPKAQEEVMKKLS